MHTYFLGLEEVKAYAQDFAQRLAALGKGAFPYVWCPLGQSGQEILNVITQFLPKEYRDEVQVVPLQFNRDANKACLESPDDASVLKGKTVLIMDSSVHSGSTMVACMDEVTRCGVASTVSYSLVVKRGTSFVPNYFGLIISDFDRAYYLLDKIPTYPVCCRGNLRKIGEADVHRNPDHIQSGLASIDSITWADLWYETTAKHSHVYLCTQDSSVLGFISFQVAEHRTLFIDAIAVDTTKQKTKLGGALMRWAEIFARTHNCLSIELWAINDRVDFYKHMGFSSTGEKLDLGAEKYEQMRRKLLYNLKPDMCSVYGAL